MVSQYKKEANKQKYLQKILNLGAIEKSLGIYELGEYFVYPSTAGAMHRKTQETFNITYVLDIYKTQVQELYCCGCKKYVKTKLVKGDVVYPHRQDLKSKTFYQCECGLFVGCHPNSIKPLGCIPNSDLKKARKHIHAVLDPMWKEGNWSRQAIYNMLSDKFKKEYHTADIKTLEEAREVYKYIVWIRNLCIKHDKVNKVKRG